MDRYSRRSIQWAWVAGARDNVAFVWVVGGLEKWCETGIPALKACPSGLVWIATYPECCPNNDDAAVDQYARHRNADHRAIGRAGSVAGSAGNHGPAQSHSLERDDLVFGKCGPVAPPRSSRPGSCSDRCASL